MALGNERRSFFSIYAELIDSGILILKPSELRLFFALSRFVDFATGRANPGREKLMKLTGLSAHAFAGAVKGLKRKGLVEVKRASKRLGFRYQYAVPCFRAGNLQQSKDAISAFVQVTYNKAAGRSENCFRAGYSPLLSCSKPAQKPLEPYKSGDNKDRSSVSHEQPDPSSGEQHTLPLSEKKKSEVTDEKLLEIERMGIQIPLSIRKSIKKRLPDKGGSDLCPGEEREKDD